MARSSPSALREPLSAAQIGAAVRLHGHLDGWQRIDSSLEHLRITFPGFDELEEVLIQVVAVNELYGANVQAPLAMAERVVEVMRAKPRPTGVELVERIAATLDGRRHLSFASKFCHFFVDSESYPIFDKYVGLSLHHHLGADFPYHEGARPPRYATVLAALKELIRRADLDVDGRDLDRYLWLSGLFRAWTGARARKRTPKINLQVVKLFEAGERDSRVRRDLRLMCPDC